MTKLYTGLTSAFRRLQNIDRTAAKNLWQTCREGKYQGPTPSVPGCEKHVQANLVILPKKNAFDFLTFCLKNPQPCPLIDVTEPNSPHPPLTGPDADIRTDLPKYRVWRDGELEKEPLEVLDEWEEMEDPVGFLLGCSFSWEDDLVAEGLTPRHIEQNTNVPMFRTNVPNATSGPFAGNLVVSCRPYTEEGINRVVDITSRYPGAHGAPFHIGEKEKIGIECLNTPDFGDAVDIKENEIPVFHACGVTPQSAIEAAKLPLVITHSPGHMFVSDLINEELKI